MNNSNSAMEKKRDNTEGEEGPDIAVGTTLNASGHKDQLQRQYGVVALCALALNIDNAWVALGGSVTIAIANGGPPGVLYELIVACSYYAVVAACIAEVRTLYVRCGHRLIITLLVGICHSLIRRRLPLRLYNTWLKVRSYTRLLRWQYKLLWWATPRYKVQFETPLICTSSSGWLFDLASITQIVSNVAVQLYAIFHPDLAIEPWHVYIAYILTTILVTSTCVFANRLIPLLQDAGMTLVIGGGFVTIIVLAAMPDRHASSSFVWKDFVNITGWGNGVAFLTGVLNGAFTIGTVDAITHLAEELPEPERDLPKGVFAQVGLGFLSRFELALMRSR
jgi:choline transport protein